jgi:hypothetical protein
MKVKIIILIAFLAISGQATTATADLSLEKYLLFKDDKMKKDLLIAYVIGMGEAIKYTHAMMDSYAVKAGKRSVPLFCSPGKITIRNEDYFTMLNREIKTNRNEYANDAPIALILVSGFKNTFPCK